MTRLVLSGLATGAVLFCALFAAAPEIAEAIPALGSWIYLAFRPMCHQMAERCLDLGAGPLAVCARCAGLYLGGMVALLVAAIAGRAVGAPSPRVLAMIAAPTLIDALLALTRLPHLPNWPRFAIALPVGYALGAALASGVADTVRRRLSDGPGDRQVR